MTPTPSPLPSTTARTVLILGANGRLGLAAAQAFADAGWRVLAQVRRAAQARMPAAAQPVPLPLSSTAELAAQARGTQVVLHAVNPLYTRWEQEALPDLEAGLAVAERLGAHFMLPGNVYNYGESMPPVLDETTPFQPSNRKGEIRVQMEARMAAWAARTGLSASVVRAGDFFGPTTGSYLDLAVVKSLGAGKLVYPGPLELPHAWAYLPDLARAMVRVASLPQPAPFDVWHFEGHTVTGQAFLDAVEAALADLQWAPPSPLRRSQMPWGLIRAAGWVVPLWRELARMSYLWRRPHRLEGRKLAMLPGPALVSTPLRQALRESLQAIGRPDGVSVRREMLKRPARQSVG